MKEGIVINSDFTRWDLRAKVDVNYNRWKFGGNVNLTRNIYNLVNTEGRYGDDVYCHWHWSSSYLSNLR